MSNQKCIVITGATRGLGAAMAEEFVRLGHIVHGCGRSTEEIKKLNDRLGSPNSFDQVDVVSDAAVEAWMKQVLSANGAPDYLLNNAAIINRNNPLWKVFCAGNDRAGNRCNRELQLGMGAVHKSGCRAVLFR